MEDIAVLILVYILGVFSGVLLTLYIGYQATRGRQKQQTRGDEEIDILATVIAERLIDAQQKHLMS